MSVSRTQMVQAQLRDRGITDTRLLVAMADVPREEFVPESARDHAYDDGALPIGHGQTISQPWVVATICQALELRGGERVLEVGTGSGYSTAILSRLVEPGGAVHSVERVPELAVRARETLERLGYRAGLAKGDGSKPEPRSWEAIAVHAAASRFPRNLADGLADGGLMVVPIKQGRTDMLTRVRRAGDKFLRDDIAACRFVPLISTPGR